MPASGKRRCLSRSQRLSPERWIRSDRGRAPNDAPKHAITASRPRPIRPYVLTARQPATSIGARPACRVRQPMSIPRQQRCRSSRSSAACGPRRRRSRALRARRGPRARRTAGRGSVRRQTGRQSFGSSPPFLVRGEGGSTHVLPPSPLLGREKPFIAYELPDPAGSATKPGCDFLCRQHRLRLCALLDVLHRRRLSARRRGDGRSGARRPRGGVRGVGPPALLRVLRVLRVVPLWDSNVSRCGLSTTVWTVDNGRAPGRDRTSDLPLRRGFSIRLRYGGAWS
jgi:hypothetical protein